MAQLVKLSVTEGLARIVLARADANNAFSWELADELAIACEKVRADPSVRAVLLTAEGKNFCVGGDIKSFAEEARPDDFIEKLAGRIHDGIKAILAIDVPLVAAVRGAAAGAGLGLATLGDVVLCGESASFTMAYSGIGLTCDGGASWILPRLIGLRRTQEMVFLNRRISAVEASEWGLVHRVVPDDLVEDEAQAIARQLASGPTHAFRGIKRLLSRTFSVDLAAQLDAEAKSIGEASRTRDAQSAIKDFLAREKPVFYGE